MAKHDDKPGSAPALANAEKRPDQADAVRDHVLGALGRPPDLFAVQVHYLWGNQYRVNVVVGKDVTSVTIPHSYFLSMDSHGRFLASQPTITREYVAVSALSRAAAKAKLNGSEMLSA
jgi:hypothetical protein